MIAKDRDRKDRVLRPTGLLHPLRREISQFPLLVLMIDTTGSGCCTSTRVARKPDFAKATPGQAAKATKCRSLTFALTRGASDDLEVVIG